MRTLLIPIVATTVLASTANAQQMRVERLPADRFAVTSPSERVEGAPGEMQITDRSCRAGSPEETRRRIVNVAVQEWGFFGFPVLDETNIVDSSLPRRRAWRRTSWLSPDESARVAGSIAGYWSVTPDGRWILSRQNEVWNGLSGIAARWRDPWSAAFISWVMCESGLDDRNHFRRAIAHHTYIDHAIEARDTGNTEAAYAAFEIGEMPVEPGDLLCFSRRPRYESVAERRLNLGDGIRSHCDIAVKIDPKNERILAIGGNVRGAVRMKLLPAVFRQNGDEEGVVESVSTGRRTIFAHLKLRADSVPSDAFENSPTMQAVHEVHDLSAWVTQQLIDGSSSTTEQNSRSRRSADSASATQ